MLVINTTDSVKFGPADRKPCVRIARVLISRKYSGGIQVVFRKLGFFGVLACNRCFVLQSVFCLAIDIFPATGVFSPPATKSLLFLSDPCR